MLTTLNPDPLRRVNLDPLANGLPPAVLGTAPNDHQPGPRRSRFEVLTPREREVLVEVARGLSNDEIVDRPVLAYETGLMTARGTNSR